MARAPSAWIILIGFAAFDCDRDGDREHPRPKPSVAAVPLPAASTSAPTTSTSAPKATSRSASELAPTVIERWTAPVEQVFTSSPAFARLDGDAVDDIVIGGGMEHGGGGVFALSGATGSRLWALDAGGDVYATPTLLDADADGVADVVFAGRINDVRCSNGRDGRAMWSLREANSEHGFVDAHFNTPVDIGDRNADGIADLAVVQSGGNDESRPPGRLYFVSGKDGRVLKLVETPDSAETYAVPALRRLADGTLAMLIGTGGEVVPGSLHRLDIAPDLSKVDVRWSVPAGARGVVASPFWVEVAENEWAAVFVSFDATLFRVDGETGAVVWKTTRAGFTTYASPAIGRLRDAGPFVTWVRSEGTGLLHLGKSAHIEWVRLSDGAPLGDASMGVFAPASPLVADLDGDGSDEVIASSIANVDAEAFRQLGKGIGPATVEVHRFAGPDHQSTMATIPGLGGGTPLLRDLDRDGKLDLVVPHGNGVTRLQITGAKPGVVRVGRYRGTEAGGVVSLVSASPTKPTAPARGSSNPVQ